MTYIKDKGAFLFIFDINCYAEITKNISKQERISFFFCTFAASSDTILNFWDNVSRSDTSWDHTAIHLLWRCSSGGTHCLCLPLPAQGERLRPRHHAASFASPMGSSIICSHLPQPCVVVAFLSLFQRHPQRELCGARRGRRHVATDHLSRHTAFHASGSQASPLAPDSSYDPLHGPVSPDPHLQRSAQHRHCLRSFDLRMLYNLHGICRQTVRSLAARQLCRPGT